jgi:hypothetical protein
MNWFQGQLAKMTELFVEFKKNTEENIQMFPNKSVTTEIISTLSSEIILISKDDLSRNVDLSKHPNFDLLHATPAPNDDKIADEHLGEMYRMLNDQYTTSYITIQSLIDEYQRTVNEAKQQVAKLARSK